MRQQALLYRGWIKPSAFDGTPATYNANIGNACQALVMAKRLRDWSQEKESGHKLGR